MQPVEEKTMSKIIAIILLWGIYVSVAQAAETLSKGQSFEFLYLDKLNEDRNKLLYEVANGSSVQLAGCNTVIVEIVSEKITSEVSSAPKNYYYAKARKPRMENFFGMNSSDYKCFKGSAVHPNDGLVSSDDGIDKLYMIDDNYVGKIPHVKTGMDYGLMVVPFKVYTKSNVIKDGGTLGAYIGYKAFYPEHSYSFTPIFSFGYTKNQKYDATNPQTLQNQEYSANMISGAIGAIVGFSYDQFKVGFLVGRDRRKSAQIDSPSFSGNWYSIMFGIGLAQ
jgi:hypothetical protein